MKRFQQRVTIEASADAVWTVLRDVERWPEWTPSAEAIEPLGAGPLGEGSPLRIRLLAQPAAEWPITRWSPADGLDRGARLPGLRVLATHQTEPPGGDAPVTVEVALEFSGLLGDLVGRLRAGVHQEALVQEAQGLERRVEAGAPARAEEA